MIRVRRRRAPMGPGFEFYDPLRHGVTQSMLRAFMACRERAFLNLEKVTGTGTSHALFFGSFFHECLDLLYTQVFENYPDPWVPGEDNLEAVVEQAASKMERDEFGPAPSDEEAAMLEEDRVVIHLILRHYVNRYREDFTGAMEWLAVENEFRVRPKGSRVDMRGKFDGVFQRGPRKLWLFETKTKSQIQEGNLVDALPLDLQVLFYLTALRLELNRVPRGVLYNVVRRPSLRRKKDETLKAYAERINADIQKRPDHYFVRFEVPISRQELDGFQEDLTQMLGDFERWAIDGDLKTYKNGAACLAPYRCSYLPVCVNQATADHHIRERIFPELERD